MAVDETPAFGWTAATAAAAARRGKRCAPCARCSSLLLPRGAALQPALRSCGSPPARWVACARVAPRRRRRQCAIEEACFWAGQVPCRARDATLLANHGGVRKAADAQESR